jgi:hypothetical protein
MIVANVVTLFVAEEGAIDKTCGGGSAKTGTVRNPKSNMPPTIHRVGVFFTAAKIVA